jgi:ATP-dependent RNA helicase SUPV3L1/SUV3
MARGIAFQLVEALGVLERQKVGEEVKNLDQNARASLRKYGVRFGAYHIYIPALMKPAPRAMATQLWALKHEAPDAHGVTELLHLAASGRTSIPVDKETPKALYRTSGYRIAGDRAVRVDILERLADLIRPALAWREGSLQQKPEGAVDGRGFTVTGAMTSLTGASGEDFASILRALGYRMDRRPKPPEPEKPIAEAQPTSDAPAEQTEAAPATEAEAAPGEAHPETEPAPATEQTEAEAPVADSEVMPQVEAAAALAQEAEQTPSEQAAQPDAAAAEQTAAAETTMESQFIEVWRPAGKSERRPQHQRRPHRPRPQQQPSEAAAAAPAANGAPAESGEAAQQPQRRERPERERQDRRDRHERQQRMERQDKRGERKDRDDRGPRRRRGRDEGPGRAQREQYYARPQGSDRRNKEPDPNSPFAKLAALKQQLEQNREGS